MLALFLILLSFGSYCISAPVARDIETRITEALSKMDAIKQSKFQGLLTPTNIMVKKCTLKHLNLFMKSVKSLNHTEDIKLLLSNLEYIQTKVEEYFDFNEVKDSQPDCEHGEESLEDFKEKFEDFLKFIFQNLLNLI